MRDEGIFILGAGAAGRSFLEKIREADERVKLTLIDQREKVFDNNLFFNMFSDRAKTGFINLPDFCRKNKADFINNRVERVSPARNCVYFKDKTILKFSRLVVCSGAGSKKLPVKGVQRQGCFYFDDLKDFNAVKNQLKISGNVVISADTILGVRLAFSMADLSKDVKLFLRAPDFLGEQKEKILSLLKRKGVDFYENAEIEEIIGEVTVKAVRTSIPRVFAADSVFLDSGFYPNKKFFPDLFTEKPVRGDSGIYFAGDVDSKTLEQERFFISNGIEARMEGAALAEKLSGRENMGHEPVKHTAVDIRNFLEDIFRYAATEVID